MQMGGLVLPTYGLEREGGTVHYSTFGKLEIFTSDQTKTAPLVVNLPFLPAQTAFSFDGC